jgi:hypothetical protein
VTQATLRELAATVIPLRTEHPDVGRHFADGRSAFLVWSERGAVALACFPDSLEYEASLVELRRLTGGIVVQRRADGVVRVCTGDGVVVWTGFRWRFTPDTARFSDAVLRLVPQADRAVLGGLLDLSVHWLSAGRVGATLVWYVVAAEAVGAPSSAVTGLDQSRAVMVPPLSVAERSHRPALLSALGQFDRATLIRPDGHVAAVNVGLVPSPAALASVPPIGGTRHTSARRFSYDEPRALVAVVSQDGPVTVFSDGAAIAVVRTHPTRSEADDPSPDPGTEAFTHCGGCHRDIVIDQVDTHGPQRVLPCPVCAGPLDVRGVRARASGVRKTLPDPQPPKET